MNEDTTFLIFVWLCLAGPLLLAGIGFLLNNHRLMGCTMFALSFISLVTMFDNTTVTPTADPTPPETQRGRLIWGVLLVIAGLLVSLFFMSGI